MSDVVREQFFPMTLPAGVIGQWVDRATVAAEIRELNRQIFPWDLGLFAVPPERQPGAHRLQQSYIPAHPECIVFYADGQLPVGWFYSYRDEATSAYIDTIGFLPAYRRRGLYSAFLPKYIAYATALGLERVAISHHPNNRAIMIAELKVGFDIVGLELNESSGPLIKMVYFIHPDRRAGFERAFSMAPDQTATDAER